MNNIQKVHPDTPTNLSQFIESLGILNLDLNAIENIDSEMWHHVRQALQATITQSTASYLQAGRLYHFIERTKSYRYDGYNSFNQWIYNDPDIRHARRTVYACKRAYEAVMELLHNNTDYDLLLNIGYNHLLLILPHIKNAQTKEDKMMLIHSARTLTRDELKQKLSNTPDDEPSWIHFTALLHHCRIEKNKKVSMTFVDITLPLNMSPDTCYKLFGNRPLKLTIRK